MNELKLVENADYFVRCIPFPNYAADGVVSTNDDGTFNIYINEKLDDCRKRKALKHEIEHIMRDHFYSTAPVQQIEAEADC